MKMDYINCCCHCSLLQLKCYSNVNIKNKRQCQHCILESVSCYGNVKEFNLFGALVIAIERLNIVYPMN